MRTGFLWQIYDGFLARVCRIYDTLKNHSSIYSYKSSSLNFWQFLLIAILFFPNVSNAQGDTAFIPYLSDVPSFSELKLDDNSLVEFDSSWGSVVEVEGHCNCKCKEVVKYYNGIMKNVGWVEYPADNKGETLYIRGTSNLVMKINSLNGGCKISFSETH